MRSEADLEVVSAMFAERLRGRGLIVISVAMLAIIPTCDEAMAGVLELGDWLVDHGRR